MRIMFGVVVLTSVALAGCTVREQQLATAGVAGAVIGSAIAQPQPMYAQPRPVYVEQRPVYVQERYMPVRRHVPRCYSTWENTRRGYVERRICDNHIP